MNKTIKDPLTLAVAAAKYPELCESRYRQLCQAGDITAVKRAPRLWELSEQSLIAYLKSNRKPGPRRVTP